MYKSANLQEEPSQTSMMSKKFIISPAMGSTMKTMNEATNWIA